MLRSGHDIVLAKFEWLSKLYMAAENRDPVAFVVVGLCVLLIVFLVIFLVVEFRRNSLKGTKKSMWRTVLEGTVVISFPAAMLYELGRRML